MPPCCPALAPCLPRSLAPCHRPQLIILTSNVGSSVIEKGGGGIGFQLDNNEGGLVVQPHQVAGQRGSSSSTSGEASRTAPLRRLGGGGKGGREARPTCPPPLSPARPPAPSPSLPPPSPEFLNRLDEIIVFRQLTKSEVKQIADIMLRQVFTRAEEKGIKIDVTGAPRAHGPARLLVSVRGAAQQPRAPRRRARPPAPAHRRPAPAAPRAERFKDRLVDEG